MGATVGAHGLEGMYDADGCMPKDCGRPIRIRLANADLLLAMFFLHKDCVNCLISAWLVNPFARNRDVSDI